MAKTELDIEKIKTICLNFLLTVKAILLSPRVFFEQMISSGEGDWRESFYFFCACAAINAFMHTLMSYSVFRFIAGIHPVLLKLLDSIQSPLFWFVVFMSLFLMLISGALIVSAATAFIAKACGGKGTYLDTYKVIVCSSVVLLYSWIPYIGSPFSLYYFVLVWYGLCMAHELKGWKTFVSLVGGSTVYVSVSSISLFCIFFGTFAFLNTELANFDRGINIERMLRNAEQ